MKFLKVNLRDIYSGNIISTYDPEGYITEDKEEIKKLIDRKKQEYVENLNPRYTFVSIECSDNNDITGFKEIYKEDRIFKTGAIRDNDAGKEDYINSVSFLALKRYAKYQNEACERRGYPKDNWRKGIPIEEYEKSMMRHLQKYFSNKYEGTNIEPEIDHLMAAWFNLQGIAHEEEKNSSNSKAY